MSSRKIIPKRLGKPKHIFDKNINIEDKNILKKYFDYNLKNILSLNYNVLLNSKNKSQIIAITEKINNDNFFENFRYKFYYIYKKLLVPFMNDNQKKYMIYDEEKIENTFRSFFSKQLKLKNIDKILSLINLQYITIFYFNKYIFPLIRYKNNHIHSEIYIIEEKKEERDIYIYNFIKKYIDQFYVNKKTSKPKINNGLVGDDAEIFKFLSDVFNNIVKKTQKLMLSEDENPLDFRIVIYGSYTSYIINKDVEYNDIDIYHTNPLKFLFSILLMFYFILDIKHLDVFRIPYIMGHLSLRYKGHHFTDCIYLNDNTLNAIKIDIIDKNYFINPLLQMINNIRMSSEIRRMDAINKNRENIYIKYAALLEYSNKKYLNLDFNNLKRSESPFELKIIDKNFILVNLNKIFGKKEKFDYLIITFLRGKYFLKLLDRKDVKISRQYFSFYNEIVAEFNNKNKENIFIESNIKLKHNVDKKYFNICETDIEKMSIENNISGFPPELEEIIKNNNVLLMSNFSTDFYIKVLYNDKKCIQNREVSNINKETIYASYLLYKLLKCDDIRSCSIDVENFFYFILHNDKTEDLSILSNQLEPHFKFNSIIKLPKNKTTGAHTSFSVDLLNCKFIFFYINQTEDYYTPEEFFKITSYNN